MFELKAGDIICCSTPFSIKSPISWLSAAIRKVSKSDWSHCAVAVSVWGRTFVSEALATGIVLRPLEEWPRGCNVCVMRPKEAINEKDWCIRALSKVGHTGYDYGSLFWYQLIYQLTGHWVGRTAASKKADQKLYCSEYAGWLYKEQFPEWWRMSPSQIQSNSKGFDYAFIGPASELA
jgi:hypothetical protein